MTKIKIDGKDFDISPGLTKVGQLYELAKCGEGCLFLNRDDGLDIPVLAEEWIVIRGDEKFVVGKPGNLGENPTLRKKISIEFNGEELQFSNAKIVGDKLKGKDKEFPNGRMFVDIPDGVDAEIEDDMILVLQDGYFCFVIPPSDDGDKSTVDLEECGKNKRRPPKRHAYRIRIDGQKYKVASGVITGAAILALVNKTTEEWALNEKMCGGSRVRIEPEKEVDLTERGVERFETIRRQAQQGGK